MDKFDSVFAQAIEPGLEYDDSIFAQQDSDAIDIINHSGKFSDKTKDFGSYDYGGLGDDIGPGKDTPGGPNIDTSKKASAYANDTDMVINDKFDEAAQNLLEELISGEDDGSDELDLFDDDSDDNDDIQVGDYHDPSDNDFEDDDDEEIANATVNDTPATRGIDAPIPTSPEDIAINDINYEESANFDSEGYSKFLEWAISSGVPLTKALMEDAKKKFIREEDETIAASDIKPTKQDKELVDDEIVDDTEDEEDIEDVEDKTPEKGKVSDAVIDDLNADEDEDILNDLAKD